MTPVIIPVHATPPPRCPSCRERQSIKTVCRHCGHEYRDSEPDRFTAAWVLFGFVVAGLASWFGGPRLAWRGGPGPAEYVMAGTIGAFVYVVGSGLLTLLSWAVSQFVGGEKRA